MRAKTPKERARYRERVSQALVAVSNGMPVATAARKFGVCRGSIRNYLDCEQNHTRAVLRYKAEQEDTHRPCKVHRCPGCGGMIVEEPCRLCETVLVRVGK